MNFLPPDRLFSFRTACALTILPLLQVEPEPKRIALENK